MKVKASFYSKETRKNYVGTIEADSIDDGIGKIRLGIARKFEISPAQMINTDYSVLRGGA